LPHPPRGHRWVRVNGDYLLIAIASGVIAQAIFAR
jgi:Ni/Co efflux regulator RcnB